MRADCWREGLGPFRTVAIPKGYFFLYSAGTVFLLPFINVFYRQFCGFSEELIGVLCALKPWVAAPAGSLIVSYADHSKRHMAVLIAVYLISYLGRSVMALFTAFSLQLALALVTEAAASPLGALIDAAVMASATDDGGYGRIRMFASVGWGLTAPLAGWVVGAFGLRAAFLCFTLLVGLSLVPAALLPMEVLATANKQGSSGSDGAGDPHNSKAGEHQLACTSADKLCTESSGGASAGAEGDGEGPFTVHVSGDSQHLLAAGAVNGGTRAAQPQEAGGWAGNGKVGPPSAPALEDAWSLKTASYAADRSTKDAVRDGGSRQPVSPVVQLTADCRTAGHSALLSSPERPLLSAATAASPASPASIPAGSWHTASGTLEIAVGSRSPSKAQLAALAGAKSANAGAAGAADAHAGPSVWQGLKQLLRDIHVCAFFWLAFLMGIGNGCIGYLFLRLDDIGAPGTLMGLCLSFNCAAEVPVFFFSGPLLARLGVERALNLAMGAYVLRLLCYLALPLMPSPWCVLPVELLQGLTFALAWSAGTVNCKRIAPPNLRSTVQSVFQGLYAGIGAGLGGLVGGLLYGSFGAAALFRTAALTLAVGWLGSMAVLHFWGGAEPGAPTCHQPGHQRGAAAPAAGVQSYQQLEGRASSEDGEEAALLTP